MNLTLVKKVLSVTLCVTLIALTTPIDVAAFQSQTPPPASDYSGQGAPQTAAELQALVAPIALYPDALVAQILSGCNIPRSDRHCRQLASDQQSPHRKCTCASGR